MGGRLAFDMRLQLQFLLATYVGIMARFCQVSSMIGQFLISVGCNLIWRSMRGSKPTMATCMETLKFVRHHTVPFIQRRKKDEKLVDGKAGGGELSLEVFQNFV